MRRQALALAAILAANIVLHLPLLSLPYFWDEAGHFIPAARDLMRSGDPIPTTTLSNAHPPLLMAYLALFWKVFGFAPEVTRLAMLLVSSFALLAVFRLAWTWAGWGVAVAATVLTGLYPVIFAQASLAHLDVPAAALTLWGLVFYLERRLPAAAALFSLAALAKATALAAPLALLAWELASWLRMRRAPQGGANPSEVSRNSKLETRNFLLLLPVLPLALWFAYHYSRTGYLFGNPEFFHYNVADTLHPLRVVLAALMRLWHAFGHMNMLWLTAAMVAAMFFPPLRDSSGERPRIPLPVQSVFAVVLGAYVAMLSLIGGAVLARYLLPVLPLVIIVAVSTLRRRVRLWPVAAAAIAAGFVLALFVDPPYRFPPEENLAYRDAVRLHQAGSAYVEQHHPGATVLTAWPLADALRHPDLGYVAQPLTVVQLDDFSAPTILAAAQARVPFDVALLFSRKPEPARSPLDAFAWWQRAQQRFFDYRQDLPPELAAQALRGNIVFHQHRGRQWVAVIVIERDELALGR